MHQSGHEAWNARHYPGTRQLCTLCDEPTGRCEDDSLYASDESGPYCEKCWMEMRDRNSSNAALCDGTVENPKP